ncbi:MAG TPA: DUF4185 domain-containing protein [Tepidisphaeraceae bacterium]|nr:DUF4185 domain-containing protein [Tepidisphaeraceae bacterium]
MKHVTPSESKQADRRILLVVAFLFISPVAFAADAPATRPSPVISNITWDFDHLIRLAHGSDLWPTTWAADDAVYAGWGDGGGFVGDSDTRGRVSIGFARIEGMPPNIVGHDVWGDHKGNFAEHQATFPGKPVGLLSMDGVLYAFVTSWWNEHGRTNPDPPEARLAWSQDAGATWTMSQWKMTRREGEFFGGTFVNFGKGYAGAMDENVYVFGSVKGRRGAALARVNKHQLRDIEAYEFFAGAEGKPLWTKEIGRANSVFVDPEPGASDSHFSVIYDAPLKRYLATWSHDGAIGGLWVLDAPKPWGPWTVVAAYDDWGHYGKREALLWSIPTKWISADGKMMWCVFSAGRLRPSDGMLDSFNLVRMTLEVKR